MACRGRRTDSICACRKDGHLYFTSQDGRIYCARIKHQAVIWNYDSKSQIETSPLVEEGRWYSAT